jgi:Rrf2 family protein
MLELALNYNKGNLLLKDIAKRQDISEGYLEHLIPSLKAAGLVKSGRGPRGGYSLARPPDTINMENVVRTMEGSLYPAECVDNPGACDRINYCVTQDVWRELGDKISETLSMINFRDLADKQKKKAKNYLLYHI